VAYLIAAAVIAPSLVRVFGRQKATMDAAPFYRYFRPAAAMTVCLVTMYNANLVLIKHFFDPVQAGHYAALATMVSPVYILGSAVSAVLYPVAAAAGAKGERSAPVLRTGMAYVGAISLGMTLAYWLFPSLIIAAMFGPDYEDVAPLLWRLALATSLFTLVGTYARYELAIGSTSFVAPLVLGATLEVALLVLFHHSLEAVVGILALTFSLTLTWLLLRSLLHPRCTG
jgi:O-antigen/teichoic acid export membrane protein